MKTEYVILFVLSCVTFSAGANLKEGSPCMAGKHRGVCRHWKTCFTLVIDIRDKTFPPLCSFDGQEPIICCTSCELVKDVSKAVINPRGLFLWKTDQVSWNQCIDNFIKLPYEFKDDQIGHVWKQWNSTAGCHDIGWNIVAAAGGHDARRTEFAHMALLGYGLVKKSAQYLCGGSVISDRFILTAGHCTSTDKIGPVTHVALGILKRSDPQKIWQKYNILRIVPYPGYHPPAKYHDIALLKTTKRITFNENVMPACLPNLEVPVEDYDAIATGWGALGPNSAPADTLQAVRVVRFSKDSCSEQYQSHRLLRHGYVHAVQMCYGGKLAVRDTCKGDSGGPLQVWGQIHSSQYTVIGVTSYGLDCGRVGRAGMYTRVAPYIPWIEGVIWK